MGQTTSKASPSHATTAQVSPPHATTAQASTAEEISTPAPRRRITRLSELIDLDELFEAESPTYDSPDSPTSPTSRISPSSPNSPNSTSFPASPESPSSISPLTTRRSKPVMVQSPSGQILSPQEFLQRTDRKLTLAERKQSIRMNVETRIQEEATNGGKDRKRWQKKARKWCFGFWGA